MNAINTSLHDLRCYLGTWTDKGPVPVEVEVRFAPDALVVVCESWLSYEFVVYGDTLRVTIRETAGRTTPPRVVQYPIAAHRAAEAGAS